MLAIIVTSFALLGHPSPAAQADSARGFPASPQLPATASYAVTLSLVEGVFYPNPANSGTFDSSQLGRPVFSQQFPVINFDPPASAQGACARPTHVTEYTRPYTDVITSAGGQCETEVARVHGSRAGLGMLSRFEAVFQTTLTVAQAGQITFDLYSDDGWIIAIGSDVHRPEPSYVSGPLLGAPPAAPVTGYPVLGSYNAKSRPSHHRVKVWFPTSGTYPVEIDYTECCRGQDVLVVGTTFASPIPIEPQRKPPTITRITPDTGPPAGGTQVTIYGSRFSTAPGLTIFQFGPRGKLATSVSCASPTECSAVSPPGSGAVDVIAAVESLRSAKTPGDRFVVEEGPVVGDFVKIPPTFESPPGSSLRLRTPPPKLLAGLPIGVELVPELTVEARLRPHEPQPTSFADLEGGNFTHIGSSAFSATCICGLRGERQLLAGATFDVRVGVQPPEEEGTGEESAFALSVADAGINSQPVRRDTPLVVPEVRLGAHVSLSVQLYRRQAIAYAAEKLAEDVLGGASAVLTDGADAPEIIAVALSPYHELASKAAEFAKLVSEAKAEWQLPVHVLPIAQLMGQLVGEVAKKLVSEVKTELLEMFRRAKVWMTNHVLHTIGKLFSKDKWVVIIGRRTLKDAGDIVSRGWRFTHLAAGANRQSLPNTSFEALVPQPLELSAVPSQEGLGFGPRVLSRQAALLAVHALVKYELPAATVRPLLVSSFTPEAGHVLCVAGGHLRGPGSGNGPATAEIELTGPGYRGSSLIRTLAGVGGSCVTLPVQMAAGRWTVSVVDYGAHRSPSGVLVDAFPFTMQARKQPGREHTGIAAAGWVLIGLSIAAILLLLAAALGPAQVRRVAPALLVSVIGAVLIDLGVELQDHTAQAVVLTVAGATALSAGVVLLRWQGPLVPRPRVPRLRLQSDSGSDTLRALMGAKGWSTADLVVVGLGAALAVFFAGVTAAVAAGQTPPTPMWAAGSAVAGALIGLLVPSPGSKAAQMTAANEAADLAKAAEATEATARIATAKAGETPEAAVQKAMADAAEAAAQQANADAAAHKAAAAGLPETTGATRLLLAFFLLSLGLGIALAAGAIVPPQPFIESLKSVTTVVIALASASGSALIGVLAPTASKGA